MVMRTPHTHVPLPTAQAELRAAAQRPFADAVPIPPVLHHNEAFAEHERRRIFSREWICVGRRDELSGHGRYLTFEVTGTALFVIAQRDGSIKAFVNACAHRHARLLADDKGHKTRIVCPYHAWTYDCDGSLIKAPHMEMAPDFAPEKHPLREVCCAVWEGFLFVNLAPTPATSPGDTLAPLRDALCSACSTARLCDAATCCKTWGICTRRAANFAVIVLFCIDASDCENRRIF